MDNTHQLQIQKIKRGVVELINEHELIGKLSRKGSLRVKYGADPSAPDLHLGHTVCLKKLRQFQELGHTIVFIIGDFTARIGDPSGRSTTRPAMSEEEVLDNAKTYQDQVFRILDKKKTEVRYNSEWFDKMKFSDVIDLASRCTVSQMLVRDDFSKRYESGKPISIVEFLYPIIQAYDSVMVESDIEIGGTDQTFNLLLGRDYQKEYEQEPQVVLTLPLLEGTDGKKKMSKSLNNSIGITESPKDIFGKIMRIDDDLMFKYYELLTDIPMDDIDNLKNDISNKCRNPKEIKEELASHLCAFYCGDDAAHAAREEFNKVHSKKEMPSDIDEYVEKVIKEGEGVAIIDLMLKPGNIVSSKSEARRLIKQKAVSIDNSRIDNELQMIPFKSGMILKVGKRKFVRFMFNG